MVFLRVMRIRFIFLMIIDTRMCMIMFIRIDIILRVLFCVMSLFIRRAMCRMRLVIIVVSVYDCSSLSLYVSSVYCYYAISYDYSASSSYVSSPCPSGVVCFYGVLLLFLLLFVMCLHVLFHVPVVVRSCVLCRVAVGFVYVFACRDVVVAVDLDVAVVLLLLLCYYDYSSSVSFCCACTSGYCGSCVYCRRVVFGSSQGWLC